MKKILLILCGLSMAMSAFSQKSAGGTPFGLITPTFGTVQTHFLTPLNTKKLLAEDIPNDKNGHWPRIAVSQQVNITTSGSGNWSVLPNGDRVWHMRIKSKGAKGLILSFANFHLSPGGRMFIYNEDQSHVVGAYTYENNTGSGIFAAGLQGDNAIIELYEPASETGLNSFTVFEIAQAYRLLGQTPVYSRDFGDADPCQVNVNCSPEGDNWQDEKKGVARILLKDGPNWGWCSGSLVNNTAQDCSPYFLTAHHCGETSSSTDRDQWIFYFDYESSGCTNGTNPIPSPFSPPPGSHTTIGCSQLAHSNDGGGATGSDFKLLNLDNLASSDISNWGLYFNGWNASGTTSSTGVGIHHPSGDIKKISTYNTTLTTTQWNGNGLNSHWLVQWISTSNGHGVTEGGSSGSPIFNATGLIVGTLTGGSSYCSSPNNPDLYGKMSYHWDQNATPLGGHLEAFLDPVGSGTNTILTGTYAPCSPAAPNCAFTVNPNPAIAGQTVAFTDNSTNIPTSWIWDFGDFSPTSSAQNPTHVYSTPGSYTVSLIASNAYGSCTTTAVVSIDPSPGCDTLNFPPPGNLIAYGDGAGGYAMGSNQYGDLAKAQRFASYAPYTHVTGAVFGFFTIADGGNGAIARFRVWDEAGSTPNTALATVDVPLATLDPLVPYGGSFIQIFFNNPVNVAGNPFYIGVEMVNFGTGDSLALISNTDGDAAITGQSYEMTSGMVWTDVYTSWGGLDIDLFISPFVMDNPPTVNIGASDLTICEGSIIDYDGTLSTYYDSLNWFFSGGNPGTSSGSTPSVAYASAGSETTYLQAFGSCGSVALDSVSVTINTAVALTATSTDENCNAGDGSITALGNAGTPPYQYSIDNGTSFQGSGTFIGLGAGSYLVMVEDANGCRETVNVTVGQDLTGPATTTSTSVENCGNSDGTVTVSATGAVLYSIDGGITFQASNVFNGLSAGSYTVIAQDANGCQGTASAVVGANSNSPTATATATNENCGNSDATITVGGSGGAGGYTYSIDNGSTFQGSTTFTGLSAGSYQVVVQDAAGCTGTFTAVITNVGGPSVTGVTQTDVLCNGGSDGTISVSATGGTLSYSLDGITYQPSNIFSGLAAGSYTVYVDNGACPTTDGPHVITEPPALVISSTASDAGCNISSGQINITSSGGVPGYMYSVDCGSTFQTSSVFTGLAATNYCVVVEDANGCQNNTSVTVGSIPPITINSVINGETCNSSNGSISLTASGGDTNYEFSIDGGITYQTSGTFTGLSAGTYNISVIDQSNCSETTVLTILNTGGLTITTNGNQTICDGDPATLTASGGTNYNWFEGASSIGSGSSIVVNPTSTTTYSVIGDDGMCFDTAAVTITVTPVPVTGVTGDTTICTGETATLSASGGTTYSWPHSGETTASVSVSPITTTTYDVTAFNGTCAGNTVQITVQVDPAPVVSAGSDVSITALGSMNGAVSFNSSGSTGTIFNWDFGDGNTSSLANPAYNYTTAGIYTVILTVSDGTCSANDTLTITVVNDVSVNELNLDQNIHIYPNPTHGVVTIRFDLPGNYDVQVNTLDIVGQLIHSENLKSVEKRTFQVDLTKHASGYYFINVRADGKQVTRRITLIE